jgi:hypothetical protein
MKEEAMALWGLSRQKNILRGIFINNQQMHRILAVDYYILTLLHVSTRACHHQGAVSCLLGLMHSIRM